MKYTKEEFIEKARKLFPDYDYSKVEYIDSKTKVIISCREHGEFPKKPADLLFKKGCPKCGRLSSSKKHRSSKVIENYNKHHETEYYEPIFLEDTLQSNMLVFCNVCGLPFVMIKNNFISGRGCRNCFNKIQSFKKIFTTEQFIEKSKSIHGNTFDYSKVEYKGKNKEVLIGCKRCNRYFLQKPEVHWKGYGCTFCSMSIGEQKIYSLLVEKNVLFEIQKKYPNLRDKELLSYDFYIPKLNLLIEYNGRQHYNKKAFGKSYKEFLIQKHHDWLKRKYAKDNKINLLVIPYWNYMGGKEWSFLNICLMET